MFSGDSAWAVGSAGWLEVFNVRNQEVTDSQPRALSLAWPCAAVNLKLVIQVQPKLRRLRLLWGASQPVVLVQQHGAPRVEAG